MAKTTKKEIAPRRVTYEVHYPENLDTVYANHTEFMMSNMDLMIDFGMRQSHKIDPKKGTIPVLINARVIMSPQHAKQVVTKLLEIIKSYEKDLGEIRPEPKKK